jgi:hypothetical protein
MPFIRNACLVLISSFILVTTGFAAGSGDPGWKLLQAVGEVTVGGEGLQPVAVRRNDFVPLDGWVQTGATGRAVLVRGGDTVVVAPGSRVKLPAERVNGNTQIWQSLGSVFYSVSKQKAPHFQVDTPYMAAVVKGTSFVITVADERSRIDVTEGLVEVSNTGRRDVEFVRPGFSATVAHVARGSEAPALNVMETSALPPLRAPESDPAIAPEPTTTEPETAAERVEETSALAPAANGQTGEIVETSADGSSVAIALAADAVVDERPARPGASGAPEGVSGVIAVAIGETRLDVSAVSDGLAEGVEVDREGLSRASRHADVLRADDDRDDNGGGNGGGKGGDNGGG